MVVEFNKVIDYINQDIEAYKAKYLELNDEKYYEVVKSCRNIIKFIEIYRNGKFDYLLFLNAKCFLYARSEMFKDEKKLKINNKLLLIIEMIGNRCKGITNAA